MAAALLSYRRFRYLWAALGLSLLSSALYLTQGGASAAQPANGGTWQGYTLGGIGAALIVWLSLIGIRKRRYRSRVGTLLGWSSAHVYLGSALLLVATLHCALQFGFNVHTLAYLLMVGVILSGVYGAWAYAALPQRVADNGAGCDALLWKRELTDLDRDILRLSAGGSSELQALVASAVELTRIGGGSWSRLRGRDRSRIRLDGARSVDNSDQQAIMEQLAARIPDASRRREAQLLNDLLDAFARRQVLLRRLREDLRLAAMLRIWLYLHLPLSIALLAALSIHVLTVFLYW